MLNKSQVMNFIREVAVTDRFHCTISHSTSLSFVDQRVTVSANWIVFMKTSQCITMLFNGQFILKNIVSLFFIVSLYPVASLIQRLPSGNRSCFKRNLISVCTLKQSSGGTSCGLTNIKSDWNVSGSDWKCSLVHKYWLNQSKWTFST